jgi:argonaute-like protein implicated in RNA metabolism and viral defense
MAIRGVEYEGCPNAFSDSEGNGFRCKIADRAYEEGLNVLELEAVTAPLQLHIKGIGDATRCGYESVQAQRRCFGSLVDSDGLDSWIDFAKRKERQIILRGNENKAVKVFGKTSIESIRKALAKPSIDFTFVVCKLEKS